VAAPAAAAPYQTMAASPFERDHPIPILGDIAAAAFRADARRYCERERARVVVGALVVAARTMASDYAPADARRLSELAYFADVPLYADVSAHVARALDARATAAVDRLRAVARVVRNGRAGELATDADWEAWIAEV